MFTGLIKDIGEIESITRNSEGKVFRIRTELSSQIGVDDSVATNGVCLTATNCNSGVFTAQAVHVTLEKTSLGKLKVGDKVNLELALRANDRLGGHFVQGHVNGLAVFTRVNQRGNNWELWFRVNPEQRKYFIKEGSVAIEGISLTIADLNESEICVSIIPHTWLNTNLHQKKIGDSVNIEVDVLAKYVESFLLRDQSSKGSSLMDKLTQFGY